MASNIITNYIKHFFLFFLLFSNSSGLIPDLHPLQKLVVAFSYIELVGVGVAAAVGVVIAPSYRCNGGSCAL